MINEDALRKIRKCLALASSDVPGEAEAAMRQAQALMRKYGVTEGALNRSAIKEAYVRGQAGQRPAAWETFLVQTCCRAFGGERLWCAGPKGGKGNADNGYWLFVADASRVDLIVYTYTVLVRKVLKARAARSAEWHIGLTRPQKAAMLDDYCLGFVGALSRKVQDYALEPAELTALQESKDARKSSDALVPNREGAGNQTLQSAGFLDGEEEDFHAAAKGPAEQAKLAHKPG